MDAVASTGSQVSLGEGMDLATEPIPTSPEQGDAF